MKRPVITGIGVVSSVGIGKDKYWNSLENARCGIGQVTIFDTFCYVGKLGAEVREFKPFKYFTERELQRLSRCDQFGLVAAYEAIEDSRLDLNALKKDRLSVIIGSGSGGLLSGEKFKKQVFNGKKPKPSLLISFMSAAFTDILALKVGSQGFRATISTACSSSNTAIGMAGEIIKKGMADVVITGGSESLSEVTFSGFNSLRSVDEVPCRPFDRDRKGISLGEGAAIFVVEDYESAINRGMQPYAEICGYGLSSDAYHVTAPAPNGEGIAYAIKSAIRSSGIYIEDIDYINAHGTGTLANDFAETNAIKLVFGGKAYKVPVSSTKSMIGHCLGAAGALEAAASIMALVEGIIPPTINHVNNDSECDLDYVPQKARNKDVNFVLSNSLAFGGNNTALVLKRVKS